MATPSLRTRIVGAAGAVMVSSVYLGLRVARACAVGAGEPVGVRGDEAPALVLVVMAQAQRVRLVLDPLLLRSQLLHALLVRVERALRTGVPLAAPSSH